MVKILISGSDCFMQTKKSKLKNRAIKIVTFKKAIDLFIILFSHI